MTWKRSVRTIREEERTLVAIRSHLKSVEKLPKGTHVTTRPDVIRRLTPSMVGCRF